MLLDSRALVTISDAGHDFGKLMEIVEKYGYAWILRKVTPVCCIFKEVNLSGTMLPECIPTVTITSANQQFTQLINSLRWHPVISITKRNKRIMYIVEAEYMEEYTTANEESDETIQNQIETFCTRFIEQYNKTEILIRMIKEDLDT